MKTKTLLIHLAAACIGLSAHAQLGGALSGGGGLSLGRSSGNASLSSGASVSSERRSWFRSNTSASANVRSRPLSAGLNTGASMYAPGRSTNGPPGQGGTPPGQLMLQNRSNTSADISTPRSGWFNRSWFNRGSASASANANASARSSFFGRSRANVSGDASTSTRSGLFGRGSLFGRSSTSASTNAGLRISR